MVNLSWKVYVILLKICFSMEKMTGMWTSWSRVLRCIPQIPVREKQLAEMLQSYFELCKAFDHWRIADFLTSPTQTRLSTLCERLAYTEVPSDLKQIKCIRLLLQLAWLKLQTSTFHYVSLNYLNFINCTVTLDIWIMDATSASAAVAPHRLSSSYLFIFFLHVAVRIAWGLEGQFLWRRISPLFTVLMRAVLLFYKYIHSQRMQLDQE